MVKHESDVDQRALLSSALPRNAHSRTESLLDLYCGIGLWICGTALSSTQLALQGERSQNQLLTKWQDLVTPAVRELPGAALLSGIAACATGYAISSGYAYRRAPRLVAIIATLCVSVVMFESLWNVLSVSSVERFLVVLITMVNVGLTGALGSRRRQCLAAPKLRLDFEM